MTMSTEAIDALWTGLPASLRARIDRATLAAAWQQIAGAWPQFADDPHGLFARVAGRIDQEGDVAGVQWADLALADACVRAAPGAHEAFEAGHGEALDAALAAAGVGADERAEARQRLRVRLLVPGTGEAPRLAGYAGRGSLRGWLRVAAVREALMLVRSARRRAAHEIDDDGELLEQAAVAEDPELIVLRDRCRDELRAALVAAVAALDSRERTLLRLSLRDRLTVDQLGALYRVHRSTAARWLKAVQVKLSTSTRARLAERLKLEAAEVESLIRAIGSRIDISLAGPLDPSQPA
jgi:RNA polymerase sigma-70 factor (ECF subfamily)